MAKVSLVGPDIESGEAMIEAVEKSRIKIAAALWVLFDEYSDWRLVLSSPSFQALGGQGSYLALRKAAEDAGIPFEKIPPVMTMRTTEPFIKALRNVFAKTSSVMGMRLGGQSIGDRYVEDAYVYKIS
jgi:hypothetical protein